jgi:flagellar biogenesis protein FliO
MQAKFFIPLTIIALIVIFVFAVQPIQAAPSFQTVPTARPHGSGEVQQPSPTAGGPTLTPTQANGASQDFASQPAVYICGGLLILGLVIVFILMMRRLRNSNRTS